MAKNFARTRALGPSQPDPCDVGLQLRAHFRQLKRKHPGLLGIGIGSRRRAGRLESETTIRLIVQRKPKRRMAAPRGEPLLPQSLRLWVRVLGQSLGLSIPTDVEQRPNYVPMSFGVGHGQATALAKWVDANGQWSFGAITSGHCLPVGGTAGVSLMDGTVAQGAVIARSNYQRDGIDIGLVHIAGDPTRLADVAARSTSLVPPNDLAQLLGPSKDDQFRAQMVLWNELSPATLVGVAYYWMIAFPQSSFHFQNAVELECDEPVFAPGVSGSPLAIAVPGEGWRLAAIATFATKDDWTRCLAGHLGLAIAWLRGKPGLRSLRVAWTVQELLS